MYSDQEGPVSLKISKVKPRADKQLQEALPKLPDFLVRSRLLGIRFNSLITNVFVAIPTHDFDHEIVWLARHVRFHLPSQELFAKSLKFWVEFLLGFSFPMTTMEINLEVLDFI